MDFYMGGQFKECYGFKKTITGEKTNPILVSERGTRDDRIWDVRRPNLGRETPTNIGNESSATFFSTPHKDFPTHKKQKRKEKTWPTTEYK